MKTRFFVRVSVLWALMTVPVVVLAHSSRSYVKSEHLIAQWDGIENAGRFKHDPDAAYPVELVNGLEQTLTGTIRTGDRCFELGQGYLHFTSSAIAAAINEGHATVELVIAKNGSYCHNGGFVAFGKTTRGFWAYQQSGAFLNSYSYHAKVSGQFADVGYNESGTNTVAFVLGETSEASSWLENGIDKGRMTRYATDCDSDCYIGTIAGDWLGTKANAKVFSIRVYDTVLTADELAANRLIDESRFIEGCGIDDLLEIAGVPGEYGDVTPAYGLRTGLTLGDEIPCRAPSVWTNADKTAVFECVGYKLYEVAGAQGGRRCIETQSEKSFVYVHPGAQRVLEWQWRQRVELSVTTEAGGTVGISDKWASIGDEIALTATPDAGWSFVCWRGDVPDALRMDPHPLFALEHGMSAFEAVFRRDDCVLLSPGESGDDAVAIEAAIAAAAAGDKVVELAAGIYSIQSDVDLTVGVTLRGATGNPEDVILRSNGASDHRVLAISSADAMVCGLTVENSYNNVKNSSGGGVYIAGEGGTMSNCVIRNCKMTNYNGGGGGLAITAANGLVTHCVISNCYESGNYFLVSNGGGSALAMSAGVVRNSLFVRNVCTTTPTLSDHCYGTVRVTGGVLENCTVANNSARRCAGIWVSNAAGRVVNCIVADNETTGAPDPNFPVWAGVATSFTNCVSDGVQKINDFCEVVQSPFVDSVRGDWRLAPGTAAVDTGAPLDWMAGATDIAGNGRIRGVGPDVGCFEIDPTAFGAHLALSADSGLSPVSVVCTVEVANAGDQGVRYDWDWNGDGIYEETTDVPSSGHDYKTIGENRLVLRVTDIASGAEVVLPSKIVTVYPRTHYVSKAEGVVPTAPYATPATAAPDVATALAAASALPGVEIVVMPDTYTITSAIEVNKGVCIRGATGNPEDVILHSDGVAGHRVLNVSSSGALVCGLTVENANNNTKSASGGGVYITGEGGTVSNCIIRNCKMTNYSGGGGGLSVDKNTVNALVTHCVISNCCDTSADTQIGHGGGGALVMYSGTVRNCLIVRNVYETSPAVAGNYYGMVRIENGVLENCTVANNTAGRCAGVWARGGKVINCLIANNRTVNLETDNLPVWAGEATCFTNCVSDGEEAINGTCWTVAKDPFANAAGGDWQLAPGISEVTDKGVVLDWMTEGATDIYGNPRVSGKGPDIGASEVDSSRFAASFELSADRGFWPAKVVCTVTPVNGGEGGTLCEWDWDGDGVYEEKGEALVVEHTYTAYGQQAVSVRVTDKESGRQATPSARMFAVYPKTLYVGRGEGVTPQAPYASAETAAPDIATALSEATVESEIVIAPDTYIMPAAVVDKTGVTIRGATGKPEDVILRSDGGTDHRVLELCAPKSVVCDVTIENGKYGNTKGMIGGAVYVSGSGAVMSNCVVRNCQKGNLNGGGGGIGIDKYATDAVVTHCVISNCQENGGSNAADAYLAGGGALVMYAGSVRNCLFVGNVRETSPGVDVSRYGTVRVAGGVLENCTIVSNKAGRCAGVWVSNPDGQVVNCLILGNETTVETDANLPVWAGEAESFARCVGEVKVNADCRTSTAAETYRNVLAGDFRLKKDSPAVDYGLLRGWMTDGALDLRGRSRRSGRFPDVGAYEFRQSGLALLVR